MKKVLIAIDYNPCAQKIVETGYALARVMNAETCIVHAVQDINYYSIEYSPLMGFEEFSADCSFRDIEEQKTEANNFLTAVVNHLGNNNIKTSVLDGKTANGILKFAAEWQADLVVIGAQSHNGLGKTLLGNVAAGILGNADIPVLIIPTGKQGLINISRRKLNLVQKL